MRSIWTERRDKATIPDELDAVTRTMEIYADVTRGVLHHSSFLHVVCLIDSLTI